MLGASSWVAAAVSGLDGSADSQQQAQSTGFSVTPASLAFSGTPGGASPVAQTLSLTCNSPLLLQVFYATASTSSGGGWLSVTPTSQFTPETLTVKVNTSGMSAGTYFGQVTITAPNLSPLAVPVSLTLGTSPSARFSLNPASLTFAGVAGGANPIALTTNLTSDSPLVLQAFFASAATTSGGNWLSITPTSQFTPHVLIVSVNTAGLAAGVYAGRINITAENAVSASLPVTLVLEAGQPSNNAGLVASPNSLTFTYQTGSAAPAAQNVAISANGGARTGVTASASKSWISLQPATGTTPFSIAVSVSASQLSPGEYTGSITIASFGYVTQTVSVRLVVKAGTDPRIVRICHAASGLPTAAVPGLIISIYGANLGPARGVVGRFIRELLETILSGTRVLFDGVPAPLLYVSDGQVNAVVPFSVAGRSSTTLEIERDGTRFSLLTLEVDDAAPGIFAANGQGSGQGSILNQDYSINGPGSPARQGSVVMIFATGAGRMSPAMVDGAIPSVLSLPLPLLPVKVTIGGREAEVLYAGAAPGSVSGAIQINARVPRNLASSKPEVVVTIGNRKSPDTVTLTLK